MANKYDKVLKSVEERLAVQLKEYLQGPLFRTDAESILRRRIMREIEGQIDEILKTDKELQAIVQNAVPVIKAALVRTKLTKDEIQEMVNSAFGYYQESLSECLDQFAGEKAHTDAQAIFAKVLKKIESSKQEGGSEC